MLIWQRFTDTLKILNVMEMQSNFADHLTWLQTNPDQDFVVDLLHENLFNPPEQPLAPYAQCYFSYPPSYKYFITETGEEFKSHEENSLKAYHEYMKTRLC